MHSIFVLSIGVGWVLILMWLIVIAFDYEYYKWITIPIAFLWFVVPVGLALQKGNEHEMKYPCAQYETQMHYDAALKMMRPMKVCILRGEWEDGKE